MDLGFSEHDVDGIAVLALAGDADLATLPRLLERVYRFASEHQGQHVLIDLDDLGAMEPVAAGVLVGARLHLRAGGGELDLVCTNPAVASVFVRSGLDATFTLHRSISAAAAGWGDRSGEPTSPPEDERPR